MYITANKVTASEHIPDSYLLTDEQTAIVKANYPNFDMTIADGSITDVIPIDPPETTDTTEDTAPTTEEQLRADVDYIAIMTGVTL